MQEVTTKHNNNERMNNPSGMRGGPDARSETQPVSDFEPEARGQRPED